MTTIEMTHTAAAMAMAHCVAHPSRACVGVFLGSATEASSASASHDAGSTTTTNIVRATAAIPLFHGDLTTTPYAEMAMEQIATHAAERGLVMIGAWRASERDAVAAKNQTNALETVAAGALEVIRRARGNTFMTFCVDFTSSALEAFARSNEDGSSAFRAFAYDDAVGDWRPSTTARVERGSEEETRKLVARSLLPSSDARAIEVCDFDDHFDDLSKDWRNPNFGVA